MKLGYSKSQYEVEVGQYTAAFDGVNFLEPKPGEGPRLGRDGKPMPPAMAWRFKILDGPEAGKQADKITGRVPSPKNGCGRFLVAISGQILRDGVEIDLAPFVGKRYRINVVESDNGGTHVSDQGIIPLDAIAAPAPASSGGPPPRKKAGTVPNEDEQIYIVTNPDADAVLMTRHEIQNWIEKNGKKANEVEVCKQGSDSYVTADVMGFKGGAF